MSKDWFDKDWFETFYFGPNVKFRQTERKDAKDLMKDSFALDTMAFLSFIGLQPTEFKDYWRVEFSLRDYEQYFHIKDRDEAYKDMATRLDDAMRTYDNNKKGASFRAFYLVSGYDYTNGIIQVSVTQEGKEVIEKLREQ